MNKKLRYALMDSCIRLLNHLGSQIGKPKYADIYGYIEDVACTLEALQNDEPFMQMHPDILAEALAYECKKPQPNASVIMELAFLCKSCDALSPKSH